MALESVDSSQSSEQATACSSARPEWLRDSGYKLETSLISKLLARCGIRQKELLRWKRISDGKEVTLVPRLSKSDDPATLNAITRLSCPLLCNDPRNHCRPILDLTDDEAVVWVASPLRRYTAARIATVGDIVEFVRQALEGLQFVHEQCIFAPGLPLDILVDCAPPWVTRCVPSWLVTDKFKRRLPFLRDPKFYFNFPRKCVSYKSQPCDRHDANCDHVDHISHFESCLGVGMLGSVIREDFIDVYANLAFIEPLVSRMAEDRHEKWPSIDMVVKEFEKVVSQLSKSQLRARLIPRNEKRSFLKNLPLSLRRWMPARAFNGDDASHRTLSVDLGVPEPVSSSILHGTFCSALRFAPLYM